MTDSIINKKGAKIFMDINKQPKLIIPILKSTEDKGLVVEVLSVGFKPNGIDNIPIVTINRNSKIEAYVLPLELSEWATNSVAMVHMMSMNPFPCKVEFGYLQKENRYYAEIL